MCKMIDQIHYLIMNLFIISYFPISMSEFIKYMHFFLFSFTHFPRSLNKYPGEVNVCLELPK